MDREQTCPNCHAPLPPNTSAGRCPACLFLLGIAPANGGTGFVLGGLLSEDSAVVEDPQPEIRTQSTHCIGDYVLLSEIARGGMGIVYKARQVSLNRLVALKMIRTGEFANESEVSRFRTEAEAAANLDHPNIVPIYEVGERDGRHFFSMKLIEGCSLAELISRGYRRRGVPTEPGAAHLTRRDSPLSRTRDHRFIPITSLVSDVARAVHYAHQRGILHRDLKPGNILIGAEGEPHITDFGLAKRIESDGAVTMSGAILGTPSYVAPEQAAAVKQLTTTADVYSLGATLYELLTGRPPFAGATAVETLQRVLNEEPLSPSVARSRRYQDGEEVTAGAKLLMFPPGDARIDRDLETICLKCLEKNPAHRYGSAEALAEDLDRWKRGEPIHARPVTGTQRLVLYCRRKPALAGLVVTTILSAILGLLGITWQWRQASKAKVGLREELWRSHLTRAQAERQTLTLGRRERSLEAIRAAAAIRPTRELRDEAAAALALIDLKTNAAFFPHPLPSGLPEWAFDANWKRLALTAADAIDLRSIEGDSAARLSHEDKNTRYLRFSPDGQSLAAKYFNRDFVVWDVSTRGPRFVAHLSKNPSEEESFYGFDFSADSKVVGCGDRGGTFHLFDAATGQELRTLLVTNATQPILMARFNPRFDSVALAAGDRIEICSIMGNRLALRTNLLHAARLAWHPDGVTLAFVNWYEPDIVFWNTRSGKERTLHSSQGSQFYLSFSPQGDMLATRGLDGVTRLWDLATEHIVLSTETAASLDFSSDGTKLAFDRAGSGVGSWEVVRSPVFQNLRHLDAAPSVALQTLFSRDGERLFWRAADGIFAFDLTTRAIDRGPLGWIQSLSLADSTKALWSATQDGIVKWEDAWKSGARRPQKYFDGINWRWVDYLAPKNLLGAATETNALVLALPEMKPVFSTNFGTAKAWALSPDASWLAVSTGEYQDVHEDRVSIFDTRHQSLAQSLRVDASALVMDPTGRWLATGSSDGCGLWELGTWGEVKRFARQNAIGRLSPMAFTQDGRWFAYTISPSVIEVAEVGSARPLISLQAPERLPVRGLAFSPEADLLAAAVENGVVQLWNLRALRNELDRLGLNWPDEGPIAEKVHRP